MTDKNGHALNVGDVVNFTGTIVSINNSDTHYAGVVVNGNYPAYVNPNPNPTGNSGVPNVGAANTGPAGNNPQQNQTFAFDGTQLVYVSGS